MCIRDRTLPVGELPMTVAVKVMLAPKMAGLSEELSAVVVAVSYTHLTLPTSGLV